LLKVLIAEDKMKISVQLSNAINTENVRCIEILNEGSNVYQRIKELKPDALILDLKLSGKNGIDILKEIESDEEIKTRVIIYSDNIGSVVQAVEYKCVDRYFSKLTPVEEISIVLEKMVEEVSKKNTKAKNPRHSAKQCFLPGYDLFYNDYLPFHISNSFLQVF